MTISTTTDKKIYSVGIGEDTFPFTFKVATESEIVVTEYNTSTKVETIKTLTTDYTVSISDDGTGNVVFKTAPTAGNKVIITRATPQIQPADFSESEYLKVEDIEDGLDRITKSAQELNEKIDRTPKLQKGSTISAIVIEDPVNNKPLYWKNGRLSSGSTDIDTIVSTINTAETSTQTYKNEAKEYSDKAKEYRDAASTSAATASTKASESATSKSGADSAKTGAESARDLANKYAKEAANTASHNLYGTVLDKTHSDSPITVSLSDDGTLFRIDTSGGNVVVNLPDLSSASSEVRVAFAKMTGDAHLVQIHAHGSQTINGAATAKSINAQHGVETVVSKYADNNWISFGSAETFSSYHLTSFAGDNVKTDFVLSKNPDHINTTQIYISGVYQQKSTYSIVNTNTIRFNTAPPAPDTGVTHNVEIIIQHSLANAVVEDNSISTIKVIDSAITNDKLYGGIQGNKISNGVISASHLADGIISNAKLDSSFTVGTSLLEDNSVTSAKISSGQITNAHLSSSFSFPDTSIEAGSITSTHLAADSVGSTELKTGSVGPDALATNAVETSRIKNLAVTSAKLEASLLTKINSAEADAKEALEGHGIISDANKVIKPNSIINSLYKTQSISADKLLNNTITGTQLGTGIITQSHLAANSVGSSQIINNSIDSSKVSSLPITKITGTIPATMLSSSVIQSTHLNNSIIDSSHIKANSIEGSKLLNHSISYTKLATNFSLPSTQVSGTFHSSSIADDAITNDKLLDGSVSIGKLSSSLANTINSLSGTSPLMNVKNHITNGSFLIWQRGVSILIDSTAKVGTADRWVMKSPGGVARRKAHTHGNISFGNSRYYLEIDTTTEAFTQDPELSQRIEDVRTLEGKTVTLSYWVKVSDNSEDVYIDIKYKQNFGTGTDPETLISASSEYASSLIAEVKLPSGWTKKTHTFNIASISGKNIGSDSYLELMFILEHTKGYKFSISNIQLEEGSHANHFVEETMHETLRKCQRYYEKTFPLHIPPGSVHTNNADKLVAINARSLSGHTEAAYCNYEFKVAKAKIPTVKAYNADYTTILGHDTWLGDDGQYHTVNTLTVGTHRASIVIESSTTTRLIGHLVVDAEL